MAKRDASQWIPLINIVEGLAHTGLISGAAVVAAFGNFVLAGILLLLALGVFLRFKRLRQRSKRDASTSKQA